MQNELIEHAHYILFVLLSLLFLFISIFLIKTRSLLSIVACLGFLNVIMSVSYLILDAPDVALTEAAVGGCASTVILYYTIIKLDNKPTLPIKIDWASAFSCLVLFCILVAIGFHIPDFGAIDNITNNYVSSHYVRNSGQEIGIKSVVASILASYRGLDTFGETLVIAMGGISVAFILSKAKAK
jgi:multicomponent Na+:H+ antiporter subunit B